MNFKMKKFLLTYTPTFCWCTAHDYLLMAELINEDVDKRSLVVSLSRYYRQGYFIKKEDTHSTKINGSNKNPGMYLRIKP